MSAAAVMTVGRFAPSPTGSLHLGNLRTALVAWCVARQAGGRFLLRMEDLTTGAAPVAEQEQLEDLARLGLDWDQPITRQSDNTARYARVIEQLRGRGLTYDCYCSRREIREAASAPHSSSARYRGTCLGLGSVDIDRLIAEGRRPAVRLRADRAPVGFHDDLHGWHESEVDDFVLCRADGVAAYNLAVVIDDADCGVNQVTRGADLIETTPRQVLLQQLLGLPTPSYMHVPLVLGPDGTRLSKRHGSVAMSDQLKRGLDVGAVRALLARSLGMEGSCETMEISEVLERFDSRSIPQRPWIMDPERTSR